LLKRLADTLLQQTQHHRVASRREMVRNRLRTAVWKAVSVLNPSEKAEFQLRATILQGYRLYLRYLFEQSRESDIKGMPSWTTHRSSPA
jgi:hypothetical protein